jgi:stress-induced morphogen
MTISHTELESLLKNSFPNSEIELTDIAGDENHYSLIIKDSCFTGLSIIQQHKIVKEALREILESNKLHAITIKTIAQDGSSW